MCCAQLAGNAGPKKSPSRHHHTTLSRHILATKAYIDNRKKLLNSNTSSTCPHNMVSFGLLAAAICWRVWGTPANFNRFHVLAALLQRRRSPAANQTLHDVWPSPGLVHYIYTFGGSSPLTEFCQVQNSLCVQVLRCHTLPALLHGTWVVGISQTLRRWAEGATYIRQDSHGSWCMKFTSLKFRSGQVVGVNVA